MDKEAYMKAFEAARHSSKFAFTDAGMALEFDLMQTLCNDLPAFIDNVKPVAVLDVLRALQPEVFCFYAVSTMIAAAAANDSVNITVENLAIALADEINITAVKDAKNKFLYANLLKQLRKIRPTKLSDRINYTYSVALPGEAAITPDELIAVSLNLVYSLVNKFSNIFSMNHETEIPVDFIGHMVEYKTLTFTDAADEFLNEKLQLLATRVHKNRMMVCKPKPWANLWEGGYLLNNGQYHRLIKKYGSKQFMADYQAKLESTPGFNDVMSAINILQEVPFKINADVYWLMKFRMNKNSDFAGIPGTIKKPRLKPFLTCRGEQSDAIKAANKQIERDNAKAVKKYNKAKSNKLAIIRALSEAEELLDEPEIFTPMNMDWRGRIYATASALSIQGADYQKALLLCARGQKLGRDGFEALCLQAANCYADELPGYLSADKAPITKKLAWARRNKSVIKSVARGDFDRNTVKFLNKCDAPLQFYAVCKELSQLFDMSDAQRAEFVSYIPIAADASCSGQQHFAALMRDRYTAIKVNLCAASDDDTPTDLYTCIVEIIDELIAKNTSPSDSTKYWMSLTPKYKRKLVKRPVMTNAYGVSGYGARLQILETLDDDAFKDAPNNSALAKELTDLYLKAMATSCKASVIAMNYMQSCVKTMAKHCNLIDFVTPDGLLVRQSYTKESNSNVKTLVDGQVRYYTTSKSTDEINDRKSKNAISPNFVHSLDATLIREITRRLTLNTEFTGNFLMIHDSIATTAGDYSTMLETARKSFHDLYAPNNMEILKSQLQAQLPAGEILPEPVLSNDYDIAESLNATYMFA
jgi:DNA-directed RNA polymerase